MKTSALYHAAFALFNLSKCGPECRAAMLEAVDDCTLFDCGNLLPTAMATLSKKKRIGYMKRVARELWLIDPALPLNLVFVFHVGARRSEKLTFLLHAKDLGDQWRLRLMSFDHEGTARFCPIEGLLGYELDGMRVGSWPLGGEAKDEYDVFNLLDLALTGFERIRQPTTFRKAENRRLQLSTELIERMPR